MSFHRPVVIMEMPERLVAREAESFMQEFAPLLECEQPRIVFDFSGVRNVDRAGAGMVLHCLREAMQRDGELKLAGLSPEAEVALEFMRKPGVLQTFLSSDEAVRSFRSPWVSENASGNVKIGPSRFAPASLRKAG